MASRRWMAVAGLLSAILVLAVHVPAGRAQVLYGSIVGTVQDASGAVVPNATVTIVNKGTGQTQSATTTAAGTYSLQNILQGTYDLSVAAKGFRGYTRREVPVIVNTARREDVTLEVGQVSESVTVEAQALTLQTEKTDVHTDLSAEIVQDLPLPHYRNYQTLINLVPGATPGVLQNSIQVSPERALSTNINGVNRNNNATRIDGVISVYLWLVHHAAYVPPAETIDTVNISTNNFDAEQGMAGGAEITVVTKSGTNELHGSAFAFNDNRVLRAKNFFNTGYKPESNDNIDGVTIGGPIKKNKLFFFGGWEGNRERLGFNQLMTVATPDQRAGDFSAYKTTIYDPATGNADGTGRTAFANNIVPASRQSAITQKIQALAPQPNLPGVIGNYSNAAPQVLNRDNFDTKINWNRTDTHSIWGKYSIMPATTACVGGLGAAGGVPLCQGSNIGVSDVLTQVATIGHTMTFSPSFVWDGAIGYTRMGISVTGLDYGKSTPLTTLGIPGTNGGGTDIRNSGAPQFSIDGGAAYSQLGGDTDTRPYFYRQDTYTTTQNFGWTRAKHDIRFGFEGARHHMNFFEPDGGGNGGPQGLFAFTGGITGLKNGPSLTQYNGYAAFLMGLPQTDKETLQFDQFTAFNPQYAWYVRDRWQLTQKLTLSLGVRYELYPLMTRSGRGGIEEYDASTNLIALGGVGGNPRGLGIATSHKLFAPRVGFAYRIRNSTVIRSGFGITYDPMPLARPLRGFFPLTVSNAFTSANSFQPFRPIEQGIPAIAVPDMSKPQIPVPPTAQVRYISGNELKRGYTESWNFIIERELPWNLLTSVGYVGTQSVRLFADLDVNSGVPGGGTAGQPLFAPFGRSAITGAWNGFLSSNYHSLQISVNRRAASGLTLKGAYTWSKAINMTDEDGFTSLGFNYAPDINRNRALAGYDIPQNFQMGFVYELPFGQGKRYAASGPAKWLLGGWQTNGVFSAISGKPFTVTASGAALNAPDNTQTADQVKTTVERLGGVGPGQPFYDRTAFAPVNQARFGTSGRNILLSPNWINLDLSLFRRFPIRERLGLEFRAEAYNSTNTPHFDTPSTNVNSGSFMQITQAEQDQRQVRLGLRLYW
ncbi:MAG TPA: TonB-dependent receptor [Bryobacterales bacterium]|nr:TonB-dependent receptor [Bryobacterales bacterium]